MVQLIQTIIKRIINIRSLLASRTNNNLRGPNMPKYDFAVLMFLFSIEDMYLLDIICYVANPENAKMSSYLTFYHTILKCPCFL